MRVITMSTLGVNGRFGNQIFQYAFLKTYALKYHCVVLTPDWIGKYLFGFNDPPIFTSLPIICQQSTDVYKDPIPHFPFVNVDFYGYFQYHTSYYAPFKDYIRYLFTPVPNIKTLMDEGVRKLRERGKTVVAFHIRRGDYVNNHCPIFFVTPSSWYKKWLENNWHQLDSPVLFIASDEPDAVLGDFREYDPVTSAQLGVYLPHADFYPDFYILSQSDIVLISNSTFSFAACMLNDKGRLFLRPHKDIGDMIPFDPWNSEPLLREFTAENPL